MSEDLEIRIAGDRVRVVHSDEAVLELTIERFTAAIANVVDRTPGEILPPGVRYLIEREEAVAVALEIEPHTRTVPWIADGSPCFFGPRAVYNRHFLAFPYIILLLVFHKRAMTPSHQLFFRTEPLERGEGLLLPNLYNVVRAYGLKAWICLQNIPAKTQAQAWPRGVPAIVDHVFSAAFNGSADEHEGESYWTLMRDIDPRVRSTQAWEAATRENPLFPLEVAWQPAGTTVSAELETMLDRVRRRRRLRSATAMATVLTGHRRRSRKTA